MIRVHLDFESRSTVDIWKSGAWVYSTHPTTQILCLCYAIGERPVQLITKDELELGIIPDDFLECVRDKEIIFVAHNAFFERVMWKNIMAPRHGLAEVSLDRWRCTAAKACTCGLPKALDKVALALELSHKKDAEGKRIMLKMCKPRKAKKNEDPDIIYWHESEEDFEKLHKYCKQDVEVERAVDHKLPELTAVEQQIWILDQVINVRGVQIDRNAVENILNLIHEYEKELTLEVNKLTNGYIDKVSKRQRVVNWLEAQNVQVPNLQKQTVEDLLNAGLPKKVHRVLEIKQQLGKTSTAKYQAMMDAIDEGSRLRDTLVYHSASTGRWGGKLVQLHNLPKGIPGLNTDTACEILQEGDMIYAKSMYDNIMGTISSCIRGMIIPKQGYELLVADYASIEARVVVWLAGEQKAIKLFQDATKDIYVEMAKLIFNNPKLTKKDKTERNLGKQAVLGCGYGMGADKFKDTCATFGIIVSKELAKKAVDTYRQNYQAVKRFWYAQENDAIKAVRDGSCNQWKNTGEFLTCDLLSGRKLYYHRPRLDMVLTPWGEEKQAVTHMTIDAKTKQYVRTSTYGGKIVENITQATARDIMAWAMCRCETYGYKPILTVHDEIIAEMPIDTGSIEFFIKILTAPISWAKGCPIAAEGWKGQRYKKT